MNTLRSLSSMLVLVLAAAILGAQAAEPDKAKPDEKPKAEKKEPAVKVGDRAPAIKVETILHPKLKSLAELKGRLVLYEYFQHW